MDFSQLGIREELPRALAAMGIKTPTPVQAAAIPLLLKGKDVLAEARTGTGKTLAFLLPALQYANSKKNYPQALIVTPTRELAAQTVQVAKPLAAALNLKVVGILGGQDFYAQKNKVNNHAQILAGTPGRLLDHAREGSFHLGGVRFFILDEVDEMLQRGFLEEITELSALVAGKRQTVVCSATLPQAVADLAKKIMTAPQLLKIDKDKIDTVNIEHCSVKVSADKRLWALGELLRRGNPYLAIVFCRSRDNAARVYDELGAAGFSCSLLQGDMSQSKRLKVMRDFRKARVQILVATDLAARGLDVEGVSHVINYDLPPDRQQYIHRAGRTGRAGATGAAITLYTPEEQRKLSLLEEKLGISFTARNVAGDELARPRGKAPGGKKKTGGMPPAGKGQVKSKGKKPVARAVTASKPASQGKGAERRPKNWKASS